jgi:hypothetical protein
MIISYQESTTGSNNLDGTAGNGLVCTGQGESTGGSRCVIRSYGIYAASALTSYALRLKNGSTNMRTIDSGTTVVSDSALDQAIIIPPGWTLEFSTVGASNGCTAWAEIELTSHV